ncbi:protein ccpA [Aspergillus lucknowensis]|uniref:Uncharacterized protein n=1 Tax=Aspergillus lucknowensis TaxID=176173 RepID=A0ABR4LXQ6_9EURO
MHFSNQLLLASAMTLAPAVYGYAVAKVEISYHEACSNDESPSNYVESSESTVATADTCSQLPAKHSFDIDAYSFDVKPITRDSAWKCHAVGVYTNDECVGLPLTIIPLWPGQDEATSRCVGDGYFDESVSVRLICEDEDGHEHYGHEEHGSEGHDENDWHDEHEHDEHDEHEEEKDDGEEDREQPASEQPKAKGGLFSGLGL